MKLRKKNSQEEDCSKIVKIQQYEPTGVKSFALFAQFNVGLEMEPLVKLSLARNSFDTLSLCSNNLTCFLLLSHTHLNLIQLHLTFSYLKLTELNFV